MYPSVRLVSIDAMNGVYGKAADARAGGRAVELKRIADTAQPATAAVKQVRRSLGQTNDLVVDARETPLSREEALRALSLAAVGCAVSSDEISIYVGDTPVATVEAVRDIAAHVIAESDLVPNGYTAWDVDAGEGEFVAGTNLSVNLYHVREPNLRRLASLICEALRGKRGVRAAPSPRSNSPGCDFPRAPSVASASPEKRKIIRLIALEPHQLLLQIRRRKMGLRDGGRGGVAFR